MKKQRILFVVLVMWLLIQPMNLHAAEGTVREVFSDSFYGGLVGTLVGGAAMLLADKPSDNKDYLSTGAGIGIILGAVYGVAKTTNAFAEVHDGNLTVSVPTLRFEVDAIAKERLPLWKVDALRVTF